MRIYAMSDIGKTRTVNQDAYYVQDGHNMPYNLFIIADGMGGHNAGEVASNLSIKSVVKYIDSNFDEYKENKEQIMQLVKNAIEYANFVVYEEATKKEEYAGMGTTIVVCLKIRDKMYIGNIGDSRLYRIRKQINRQLTKDHSLVEKLISDGEITRQESYTHPKKNMLTRALGCDPYVEVDVTVKGLIKEDIILLCTDGLVNQVPEEKIFEVIRQNFHEPDKACKMLIDKSNDAGGADNTTLIIINND